MLIGAENFERVKQPIGVPNQRDSVVDAVTSRSQQTRERRQGDPRNRRDRTG